MSIHGQKLIKKIKDSISSQNLELISSEFKYIEENDQVLKSQDIICSLINIVGNYLVSSEKQNLPDDYAIFDTFCGLDFMSKFLSLSNYNIYRIQLQLIKTLSFLLINIKSKPTLYYFFSNPLLSKIISKDYTNFDDEFLSYYVNFLKSLSLLLDETSINLFYIEKNNSFPLVENVIKFYNHKDSMIRNVVRSIIMNVLRVKTNKIVEYFSKLPALLYFVNITIHLRDMCLEIKEEFNNKNNKKVSYLFDDFYDEMIYIDDLLNLKNEKINFVIINSFFYFFILPIIAGNIISKNKKITKELALFFLIYFFVNMKNETFKNCLFCIFFMDELTPEIENLLNFDIELSDFFMKVIKINNIVEEQEINTTNNDISFYQFLGEHYNLPFLETIIKENNNIFTKYGGFYPELQSLIENGKELAKEISYGAKNCKFTEEEKITKLKDILEKTLNKAELFNMNKYHEYLSKATGLPIGNLMQEISEGKKTEKIYDKCFMRYMKNYFSYLYGKKDKEIILKKNIIKENLFILLSNQEKEELIILLNILIFIVQNKDINISKTLLKFAGLDNIYENSLINSSINIQNIDINSSVNEIIQNDSISFNNYIFTFNNQYFINPKMIIPINKYNYDIAEIISSYFNTELSLLPITYELIYQNILNLTIDDKLKNKIQISEKFIKNIQSKYKSIIFYIYSLFKNEAKNREDSFEKFHQQWLIYKDINNKDIFRQIKRNIISSLNVVNISGIDINCEGVSGFEFLMGTNFDKKEDNKEIFYKLKRENVCFETNLFIFMIIYDFKKIFISSKNIKEEDISQKLIKNKFPLEIPSDDLKVNEINNLNMIDSSKLYINQILYKIIDKEGKMEKSYITCEILVYKSFLYFGLRNKQEINNIKIFKKFDIKLIELNNKVNSEDIIQLKINDGSKNIIEIKFSDVGAKNYFRDLISERINSLNNEEILIFSQYFEKLINKFNDSKINEQNEDF